jgi:hypothetical protein
MEKGLFAIRNILPQSEYVFRTGILSPHNDTNYVRIHYIM